MTQTETSYRTTLRQALKAIRADLAGQDYLSGSLHYLCREGVLVVRNKPTENGNVSLGVFVVVLDGGNGHIRTYDV